MGHEMNRHKVLGKTEAHGAIDSWEEYLVIEELDGGEFQLSLKVNDVIYSIYDDIPEKYIVSENEDDDLVFDFPDVVNGEKVHSWDGEYLRSVNLVLANFDNDNVRFTKHDYEEIILMWLKNVDHQAGYIYGTEKIIKNVRAFIFGQNNH